MKMNVMGNADHTHTQTSGHLVWHTNRITNTNKTETGFYNNNKLIGFDPENKWIYF